jgi:hypothetical protein
MTPEVGVRSLGVVALLTTSLEDHGDRVRFVMTTADPVARERLPHLGYLAIPGGRFATRWFPASAQPARHVDHFAASIETIVRQSARLVAAPWEDALLAFLDRVGGSGLDWWLYGSAALAVRGLPMAPGDIDVRVDDAALAGRVFDDLLVTPVERLDGWVAAYAGRAFCGAVVEWIAEPHAVLDDPSAPHEQGVFVADRIETVAWRGRRVRVPPLDAQLRVCERRGLTAGSRNGPR